MIKEVGLILTLESVAGNTLNGMSSESKRTPFTGWPNHANEKQTSGSVLASIHRDSSSNAMASKQA